MAFCEAEGIDYVFGLLTNERLTPGRERYHVQRAR
jgi:hypothetical protein